MAARDLIRLARPESARQLLPSQAILAGALLCSAALHLDLGFTHLPSVFAIMSLLAAAAAAALATATVFLPSRSVWQASIVLSLTLTELYLLNVTTGLPPLLAHTHVPGTHTLFGVTLANPNTIDVQGISAQICQLIAVISASVSLPSRPARGR